MDKPTILVLDSNTADSKFIYEQLCADYDLSMHTNPVTAALMAQERQFDVLIVDFHIPDVDGLEFVQIIRPRQQRAVVIVTCHNASAADVQRALRLRVNDFVFKPFIPDELRRQIALALMQRPVAPEVRIEKATLVRDNIILGPLFLDIEQRVVEWYGDYIPVTPTEFCILHTLALFMGQYVQAAVLIRRCRNYDVEDNEAGELIKPHIANLRHKLEVHGHERAIVNKRGLGFMLKLPETDIV
jgi:DNA-binding response OmpR family regulator